MPIMSLGSQRLRFLAGLLLLLAGLEIAVTLTYMARWVGLALMLFGLVILIFTAKKKPEPKEEDKGEEAAEKEEREERKTLAGVLIDFLTLKGRLAIESFYGDGYPYVCKQHGTFRDWAEDFVPRFKNESGLVLYCQVDCVEEGRDVWAAWQQAHAR